MELKTLKEGRAKLLEALRKEFPEADIERTYTKDHDGRKGTGKGYDTTGYKYQAVVDRFNDVLGLDGWRTTATYELHENEGYLRYSATCTVTIQIGDPDESGGWRVWAERQCIGGHDAKSLGDAKKGAYTNGFKKTAALFGSGAAAYKGELDDDNKPAAKPQGKRRKFDTSTEQGRKLTAAYKQLDALAVEIGVEKARAIVGRSSEELGENLQMVYAAINALQDATAKKAREEQWGWKDGKPPKDDNSPEVAPPKRAPPTDRTQQPGPDANRDQEAAQRKGPEGGKTQGSSSPGARANAAGGEPSSDAPDSAEQMRRIMAAQKKSGRTMFEASMRLCGKAPHLLTWPEAQRVIRDLTEPRPVDAEKVLEEARQAQSGGRR